MIESHSSMLLEVFNLDTGYLYSKSDQGDLIVELLEYYPCNQNLIKRPLTLLATDGRRVSFQADVVGYTTYAVTIGIIQSDQPRGIKHIVTLWLRYDFDTMYGWSIPQPLNLLWRIAQFGIINILNRFKCTWFKTT